MYPAKTATRPSKTIVPKTYQVCGITANAIMAGVTDTPALRKIPGHEKLLQFAEMRNPHGRLTTPGDVAKCIGVLCDAGTHWMTGNTIRVDGGEGSVA